jgi:hypothetical protein
MRYLLSVLVLVLVVSTVFADDEFKSVKAKRAKKDYDEEVEDAKKEYEKKVERAKKKYAKKLDEALKYETRKGNLEEAVKIKKVKEGLEDTKNKDDNDWIVGIWKSTWSSRTNQLVYEIDKNQNLKKISGVTEHQKATVVVEKQTVEIRWERQDGSVFQVDKFQKTSDKKIVYENDKDHWWEKR